MLALPQGAAETGPDGGHAAGGDSGCAGRNGARCGGHADRAHPGAAAAVRDAEGLVQVDVADVGADVRGAAEPDLGVQVGAVHVDLPAVLVHGADHRADAGLEHAVRRRVGDHQGGQLVGVGCWPWLPDRRDRCCRRRRRRPPRPGSRPSPRRPGWCRAPTTGSGRRRGVPGSGSRERRGSPAAPRTRPCEPAFGCSDVAAKPVMAASICSSCVNSAR